jgi:hypothetical protein
MEARTEEQQAGRIQRFADFSCLLNAVRTTADSPGVPNVEYFEHKYFAPKVLHSLRITHRSTLICRAVPRTGDSSPGGCGWPR